MNSADNTGDMLNPCTVPVCPVSSAKCIVDVDVTQLGQGAAEFLDILLFSFDLVAISAHSFALLLHMESQVLQQNDSTTRCLLTLSLHLRTAAVLQENHLAAL